MRRSWGLTLLLVVACAGFLALGVWQVRRMHWKHDLIARVDARVHAAPVDLPPDAAMATAQPGTLDYLRVGLSGVYAGSEAALVRAATELGTGYWAMTPMRLDDGRTIWINRGFVPAGTALADARRAVPAGRIAVVGLLRESEPGGSLLQANRPRDSRWYSRDVAALSRAVGAGRTAPFFVDVQAETTPGRNAGVAPVPGLTVVRFPDNHLQYALTWFALAALSLAGTGLSGRTGRGGQPRA